MKKLSIVLLAVLLIASLIISCDNSTKALTDELVEVQLGTQAGSRALSSSVTLEQISDPSLTWYYSATKRSQEAFQTGATPGSEIALGTTKTFSQGKWDFALWAKKGVEKNTEGTVTNHGTKVYYGELTDVLITKSPSSSPVPVVINVSPYVEGSNGSVQFSNVKIQKYSEDTNTINTTPANVITLDGSNVTLIDGNAIVNEVTPGPHTVVVSYVANIDGQDVVYASESILITVYSGRTTVISGNVLEEVGSAEITVIATSAKVTSPAITVAAGKSASATIEAAVAPFNATASKEDANKKTTVSFPEGALVSSETSVSGSVSATLSVDTKSIENNIQITGGSTAVAGINISLSVNGSPVTEFNNEYVTITTYIAKNLNDVKVVYNGEGAQPIATDKVGASDPAKAAMLSSDEGSHLGYNKNTGLLRFNTNHFSEFNVVADAVCYVSETNTAYSTLSAAFEAAVGSRKTVVLIKDINDSVNVPSGADVILDLNGKTISSTDTVISNYGTLTLKNGTINSTGTKSAIRARNNSITNIESGTYKGECAVITGYATGATININGGTFIASDNAVIAGNGNKTNETGATREKPNTINITGGTFNGGITTEGYVACGIYAPWKDVINVSGGTFNITKGAGIVARAGNVNVSGGTFNCTGDANIIGKVGDSRIVVHCSAIVFDSEANYPAMTADSKITVTGGTFTSEADIIEVVTTTDDNRIAICGGSFSSNPSAYVDFDSHYAYKPENENVWNVVSRSGVVVNSAYDLRSVLTALTGPGAGNNAVILGSDINIPEDFVWTPVKVQGNRGAGVILVDGNNHKITGLKDALFAGGFAGSSGIVIKDLTIENANIFDTTETQGLGAFIKSVDSMPRIELVNCHLKNSTITSTGGARVGGLIGWTAGYNNPNDGPVDTYVTIANCSVEDCTITAAGSVGGIIGHAGNNPATFHTITGCTVKDITLHSTDDGDWRVGVVVGTANVGEVTISGTTVSGNTTLKQKDETAPEHSNLYGRFVPNGTGQLKIDGVAITE